MSKEVLDVLTRLPVTQDYVDFLGAKIIEDVENRGKDAGFSTDAARAAIRFSEDEEVSDATALLYLLWIVGSEGDLGDEAVFSLLYRGINAYVSKELDGV